MSHPLENLRFDERFVRALPADPDRTNRRRQVRNAAYSLVTPTVVAKPTLLAAAPRVAELLGFTQADIESERFAEVFGGNAVLPGMQPYAACYGGHQFGNWAGQLGDGRAITLGEAIAPTGEHWELQLKGAGPTPYSRTADGRAVLRSSVREFLCSEAMHQLGVPTTRALSLVGTGEPVVRDMFYDGHPRAEPGAVVCRVAPSFLRFGNYQLPASRDELDLLRVLADHTIATHFPAIAAGPDSYLRWFEEVSRRTLEMVVHWMRVGFVHGVMNTDNMSVLGLTIDYGPYGWLEEFDPGWTPNTTDAGGRRYRYGYQPKIALWNLSRFAQAILPLVGATEPLEASLQSSASALDVQLARMMHDKLGLVRESDITAGLIEELPLVMQRCRVDMTNFFRALSGPDLTPERLLQTSYAPTQLRAADTAQLGSWLKLYAEQLQAQGVPAAERGARMNAVNPKYVLRNYMAQLAIDKAEQGDPSLVRDLLELLQRPYDEQPDQEQWAALRPEWARNRAGCSMLSCSS